MNDTIRHLKQQYGQNSPAVGEQLNSIGDELTIRGDFRTALKFHQEALTILEWNKCNALLYDFVDKSKSYTIEMARTLRKIGNLMREMNNFVGAAEVYKECLDTFLEGLVEGGGGLKRRLLECEYRRDSDTYHKLLNQVDRRAIGRILCLNSDFRNTVKDISELFLEMHCVKFLGQNAGSSRGRRRMAQHAAMEENLKNAVESLSMDALDTSSAKESSYEEKKASRPHHRKRRSMSWTSGTSESETWMKSFWEKEMGRFSRPRPNPRRVITSEQEYSTLSSMLAPAEESLTIALKRFPLPSSVVGDNKLLRQSSSLNSLHEAVGYTNPDSSDTGEKLSRSSSLSSLKNEATAYLQAVSNEEWPHHLDTSPQNTIEGLYPPPHLTAESLESLSPRSVTRNILEEEDVFGKDHMRDHLRQDSMSIIYKNDTW